jgi:hypothetical protein
MMRPLLAQCLCPNRHCLLALAFPAGDISAAEALEAIQTAAAVAIQKETSSAATATLHKLGLPVGINPWCALCGAPSEKWIFEVAETTQGDPEKLIEELRLLERVQRESAEYLKSIGMAYDGPTPAGSLN